MGLFASDLFVARVVAACLFSIFLFIFRPAPRGFYFPGSWGSPQNYMQNIYPSTSNQYPLNSYQSIPNYTPKSYQSAPLNLPSQAAHSFTALLNDDSNNYMPQVYTPYQTSNLKPPRLAKKKRQHHTKTQKEAADKQDKFLNFFKENQKRDDEIFSKLMEMSRDAEQRQNEATNKIIESIGAWFKASSKD